MRIRVPDETIVLTPEELSHDPPTPDPYKATSQALANPLGMASLKNLADTSSKIIILCPDRVKGGIHEQSHRKVCIPILVEELTKAGIPLGNIKMIISVGLHKKNTITEMRNYLGDKILSLFCPDRLIQHDAEDNENLINLGNDGLGNLIEFNKTVAESDLVISIGHTLGNPYGGYSGGYKMVSTGITTWRSIRSHHCPKVMHKQDFLPASTGSEMRKRMNSIGKAMEKGIGKRFFFLDAVLGTENQVLGVYAGDGEKVQKESWKLAAKRTETHMEIDEKFDILVFGEPRVFHYGPGHGTNPILILQAIGAQLVRSYGVFKEDGIIICSSLCNGWFNDEWFPSYRAVFDRLQTLSDFSEIHMYEDEICNNQEFINKYRFAYGYGAFHPFSMISCGMIALKHTTKIFIVGAQEPSYAEAMGCTPAKDFKQALNESEEIIGKNPRILVLPQCFMKPGFHLFKK
jgi:nickel-dependent lactate racemase